MARIEKRSTAPAPSPGVTPGQLREAERGLRLTLRATFAPAWIAQNVRDVLAEANVEYAEWARENGPARNPTGWLIERGRLRALNLVVRENRRAGPALDSVVHSIEDPGPTPEETALERDRLRRIEDALSHIPEKDRQLLALVHGEGLSLRRAGRLLGWGETNARYHHDEAMKRLRALLGPRDLLSPALLGLVAEAMAIRDRERILGRLANRISASAQDLSDLASRALGSARSGIGGTLGRGLPFGGTGPAALSNGAGRAVAQCGAMAVAAVCGAALAIPATHAVEAVLSHHHRGEAGSRVGNGKVQEGPRTPAPTPAQPSPAAAPPTLVSAATRAVRRKEAVERRRRQRRHREERRRRRRARIRRARRAEQARRVAGAKASRARRDEEIEAAEAVAPEVVEPTPGPEAVAPELEASPPPPATGGQTRQEFGL